MPGQEADLCGCPLNRSVIFSRLQLTAPSSAWSTRLSSLLLPQPQNISCEAMGRRQTLSYQLQSFTTMRPLPCRAVQRQAHRSQTIRTPRLRALHHSKRCSSKSCRSYHHYNFRMGEWQEDQHHVARTIRAGRALHQNHNNLFRQALGVSQCTAVPRSSECYGNGLGAG